MPETHLIPIYNLRLERRGSIRYADRDISTPSVASTLAREVIAEELTAYAAEQFITLYPNTKNRPVGYSVTAIGTISATLLHPREVLKGGSRRTHTRSSSLIITRAVMRCPAGRTGT